MVPLSVLSNPEQGDHCAGAVVPPVLGGVVVVPAPAPVSPVAGAGVALVVPVSAPPLCVPWLSHAASVRSATVEIEAKISFLIGQLSLVDTGRNLPGNAPPPRNFSMLVKNDKILNSKI